MTKSLFSLGFLLVIMGLLTIIYMAIRARKTSKTDYPDEAEQKKAVQQLLILNFVGIGLATLGFMSIILSVFLNE